MHTQTHTGQNYITNGRTFRCAHTHTHSHIYIYIYILQMVLHVSVPLHQLLGAYIMFAKVIKYLNYRKQQVVRCMLKSVLLVTCGDGWICN